MEEFFSRVYTDFIGRLDGPMHLRLILQPLVACIFAVRSGLRDAREGKPPFFWSLAYNAESRADLLREGWKDIATVFIAAFVLDIIYQFIALKSFYPGEATLTAVILAIIPYLLVRAPITRIANWRKGKA